jgi:DNA-binding transcriptional LysR family regulator
MHDDRVHDGGRLQITTQQIRCFVAVASSLHFGQAANELFLSQPALSRQIVRLETLLGSRLLDRSTRRVMLTPKGAEFLPYARELIASIDTAIAHLRAVDTSIDELWLSHPPNMIRAVDALLLTIEEHYPDLTVYCVERKDTTTADWGPGQLGLEHRNTPSAPYEPVEFGAEPMNVLVRPGHRLAALERITPADLAGESIIASARCYNTTAQQALRETLIRAGAAGVEFHEIPTGAVAWTTVLRDSRPTIVPAADDTYPPDELTAIPAADPLCPTLMLWWDPRYGGLVDTILPAAQDRLGTPANSRIHSG